MKSICGTNISELVAAHRPGFALAREFYVDTSIFQSDIERVSARSWLYAGHISEIPHTGNYFLSDIATEPLILIRTGEGSEEVGALMNVCRHRGSRVCLEPTGQPWMWRITAEQDRRISENTQLGVRSLSYRPGPYSTAETRVDEFVQWYLRQLQCSPGANARASGADMIMSRATAGNTN